MRGNRSAIDKWLQMAQQSGREPPLEPGGAGRDPYEKLGIALQAVIEHAVATAVASIPTAGATAPVMLSIPQAAKRLGVGTTKLKQLIVAGEVESVTIGRRRLVPNVALQEFASARHSDLAPAS
jgi:excisionase family DNA binding protein